MTDKPSTPEPRGDLAAAQQALAGLWPLLSVLATYSPEAKQLVADAKAELTPLYERAMGDLK